MYAESPVTEAPTINRTKKSTIHINSSSPIEISIMLANNELSNQSAGTVSSRAMSENHRKFPGPYCLKYTGNRTRTNRVNETFSQSGMCPTPIDTNTAYSRFDISALDHNRGAFRHVTLARPAQTAQSDCRRDHPIGFACRPDLPPSHSENADRPFSAFQFERASL